MNNKLIGSIFLIIGTSIGAGMLALPVVTAAGGATYSALLLIVCWMVMTLGAFFVLEVTLWLPENCNMVSMAKATLGKTGQVVAWVVYLLLLYSLLSAYISSGSDVLQSLFEQAGIILSRTVTSILFTILFGMIVYSGIKLVDWAMRGFMTVKVIAYLLLVVMVAPYIHMRQLTMGNIHYVLPAVLTVLTSFGFATIIPSLRTYLKGDAKKLRLAVLVGSLIPLVCYLIWDAVVQGVVPAYGSHGLIHMATHGNATSKLTSALAVDSGSIWVHSVVRMFTSLCVVTSFLGVALCLSDFLADGFRISKKGFGKVFVAAATFLPPLIIILFYPDAFLTGLSYAGIFCVILLVLLPALMVWNGRYRKFIAIGYEVWGGKALLITVMLIALLLLLLAIL